MFTPHLFEYTFVNPITGETEKYTSPETNETFAVLQRYAVYNSGRVNTDTSFSVVSTTTKTLKHAKSNLSNVRRREMARWKGQTQVPIYDFCVVPLTIQPVPTEVSFAQISLGNDRGRWDRIVSPEVKTVNTAGWTPEEFKALANASFLSDEDFDSRVQHIQQGVHNWVKYSGAEFCDGCWVMKPSSNHPEAIQSDESSAGEPK